MIKKVCKVAMEVGGRRSKKTLHWLLLKYRHVDSALQITDKTHTASLLGLWSCAF